MFKNFAEKHFNAAFGLKCLAAVAMVALTATLLTPAGALILAAAAAPVLKDMIKGWNDERVAAKQNMTGKFDQYEPTTPRMGR
jgi:hypothetical protein